MRSAHRVSFASPSSPCYPLRVVGVSLSLLEAFGKAMMIQRNLMTRAASLDKFREAPQNVP